MNIYSNIEIRTSSWIKLSKMRVVYYCILLYITYKQIYKAISYYKIEYRIIQE